MLSPSKPSTPSPWRRVAVAWMLGCLLLLGAVTPHAPAEEHGDSLQSFEIDCAAQHPGDPAHFEGSHPETHPACVACLLQIQSSSLLTPPAPLPGLLPGESVAPRPAQSIVSTSPVPGPARAPPVLASSL